jgi:LmbE family N-acetylglucosaminyl deacetylase
VFAHADDEAAVAPILARYAREGSRIFLVIVTDGGQGTSNTTLQPGREVARARAEEARCATDALGIQPPIILDFPDGALGSFTTDPSLLYRLTQRLHQELERLRPDAIITWGPDGGGGHPDHRLVGGIVTQLVRAGAPGITERLFYASFSEEAMRTVNPSRGAPPLLVPQMKYLSARIAFDPNDFEAAARAMACHRTQYTQEQVERVTQAARQSLNGVILLAPAFTTTGETSIFAASR